MGVVIMGSFGPTPPRPGIYVPHVAKSTRARSAYVPPPVDPRPLWQQHMSQGPGASSSSASTGTDGASVDGAGLAAGGSSGASTPTPDGMTNTQAASTGMTTAVFLIPIVGVIALAVYLVRQK